MANARDWIRELRPFHWVKNVFVLSPLVFSGGLTSWQPVLSAIIAFGSFCALSSAVYV